MNVDKTQASFSAGIISEELFSRLDFNKTKSGLKQCENFIVRSAGGVKYRTGTKFIAEVKNSAKNTRLIPYTLKRGLGFCLEFGENYIRFIKNGEYVLSGGVPYEVVTTYSSSEVEDIKYISSSQGLFLVHKNHAPAVLKRTTDTSWSLTDLKFNPDVLLPTSIMLMQQGYLSNDQNTYPRVDFNNWQYAASFVDKDGHEGLPLISDLFVNDISLALQSIKVGVECPISDDNWSNIDKINIYKCSQGELKFLYSYNVSDVGSKTIATSTTNGSQGRYQRRYSDGVTPTATGTGSQSYTFNGVYVDDINLNTDATKVVKQEFSGFAVGDYPTSLAIWNQRLVLAGTVSKPTTLWFSRIGNYEDFTTTYLQAADESIELTLNSTSVDVINNLVPFDDLFVLADTKIWRIVGSSVSNMSAYIESYSGTSSLSPYCSKKSILYVDSSDSAIYNFAYFNNDGGYSGKNLTLLCKDLFDGYTFKDISFKDTPIPILYSVRNDGKMVEMTYEKEENIYGWHLHTTDGKFLKVCVIDQEIEDDVYVIVERNNKKYVEIFQKELSSDEGINECWHLDCATRQISNTLIYAWVNGENKLFTDSQTPSVGDLTITDEYDEGDEITAYDNVNDTITVDDVVYTRDSSYDKPAQTISQITGLTRFAGQKVSVMADGNFYKDQEVSELGVLDLEKDFANVLVGLSYKGIIETLPFEIQLQNDAYSIGINRRLTAIIINYKDTRGLSYGTSKSGKFYEIKPYTQNTYGRDIPLSTDNLNLPLNDSYDIQSSAIIIQETPFPAFIRNITLETKYGNKN